MKNKILKGTSFLILVFLIAFIGSYAAAETQMVCYAGTGGGGGSGVTDIFGGLNGSVFATATPADDKVLIADSGSAATWRTLPDGAVKYTTSTNTLAQAACADLSDSGGFCVRTTSTTTTASSSSITLVDAWDSRYELTAQAAGLTIVAPATCTSMNHFLVRIKDNGGSQTIAYTGTYRDMQDTRPTSTTAGKWMYLGFDCNASNTLDFIAYNVQP